MRALIGGDNELGAEEYLRSIPQAIERFFDETQRCQDTQDQVCQTAAVERLRDEIGDGVPASASWIADAHGRLYAAVSRMFELNRRSESESVSSEFLDEVRRALDELEASMDEWGAQANR